MNWHPNPRANQLLQQERGTVRKDWGGRLPIALISPNSYHVGMSSLAVHALYQAWNQRDDVVCERVFNEWAQPSALESGAPLDSFPVWALTISFELDYFHVVTMLRSGGIPLHAAERDDTHPLVIAGGPAVSANPEPLAPLLDAVVIGEVEPILDSLTNSLQEMHHSREAALVALSRVPGVYLPNLQPSAPTTPIVRQWLGDLDAFPTRSAILTPHTEFADMGLIEIARGCGRGCRFCLAGYAYRPPRERSFQVILAQARELMCKTDRIGMVSAAVSDHSEIDHIAVDLRAMGARLSISSLRVDPLSEPLIRALSESGARTLTIAPEAGSERLRRVIHKTQTEEDVLNAIDTARRYNLPQIKLYFMAGLPTEEQSDIEALVRLARVCAERSSRQVTVNITPFVPKAHTPYQRLEQTSSRLVKARLDYVERELRRAGIGVKSESPAWAEVQGTLARGDRRVAEALLAVDRPRPASWRAALADAGLSVEELLAARPTGTPLPWHFIRYGAAE